MTKCDNCNGEGLVGQGDNPALKLGKLETCQKCQGTGQLPEGEAVASAYAEPVNSSAGDNSPKAEGSSDSSDASSAGGQPSTEA